ncbi:Hypothetical protein AKI40_1926 [Enterobacter sp. FY-07]|nr:Hypothetical protein AKI40_1926 [Enterobacter sp. FY-07]
MPCCRKQSAAGLAYWAKRYDEAKEGNKAKTLFGILKPGSQPAGKYSLAAPQESFPLRDTRYTRMDRFIQWFGRLKEKEMAAHYPLLSFRVGACERGTADGSRT